MKEEGGGGGGGRTPGSMRSTHSRGESLGASPRKILGNLDHLTLDFLCRLPLLGHSYILSPFLGLVYIRGGVRELTSSAGGMLSESL